MSWLEEIFDKQKDNVVKLYSDKGIYSVLPFKDLFVDVDLNKYKPDNSLQNFFTTNDGTIFVRRFDEDRTIYRALNFTTVEAISLDTDDGNTYHATVFTNILGENDEKYADLLTFDFFKQ